MKKLIMILIVIILVMILVILGYGHIIYRKTIQDKPIAEIVENLREDPDYIKIDKLPKHYIDAVIDVEDHRFKKHGAIDLWAIIRAFFSNLKSKKIAEGGSTITQQTVKQLYFIREKNVINRKLGEIFLSYEFEKLYSKDEILEMYINSIYFGNGYYGIREACQGYLGVQPEKMDLAQASMLAGIPNAPSVYSPKSNKTLCKQRQKKVLGEMVKWGDLTKEAADAVDQSFIDKI